MHFENHLESFNLYLEHDDGHEEGLYSPEVVEALGRKKLVFCAEDSDSPPETLRERILEDCSYIWVDVDYLGQLSPGQQRLYEILVAVHQGMVYSVTTIAKLAEAQGLKNPIACATRLENLQSLGAISGFR